MTRRRASSDIGLHPSRAARSAKARRATVACGCLDSRSPSAQSPSSASLRTRTWSSPTSQVMRFLQAPWSMWQGREPRAYSSANREPPVPNAGATRMLSKRWMLSFGVGTDPARAAARPGVDGADGALLDELAGEAALPPLLVVCPPGAVVGRPRPEGTLRPAPWPGADRSVRPVARVGAGSAAGPLLQWAALWARVPLPCPGVRSRAESNRPGGSTGAGARQFAA
mmetsp:Transcript_87903/g.275273  ORF Transcript_87903/g.275273 Transcript_87903/m.275273 type:complete len:226 (-) Transcript_87903:139-816(-)